MRPTCYLTQEHLLQASCTGTSELGLGKGMAHLTQLSQPQDGAVFGLSTASAGAAVLSALGGKPRVLQYQPGELFSHLHDADKSCWLLHARPLRQLAHQGCQ